MTALLYLGSGLGLLLYRRVRHLPNLRLFQNVDRRILLGMLVIVAGAVILSGSNELCFGSVWPALAMLAACFLWGLDNNLTRKISLNDATALTCVKGLVAVAGTVNLSLALFITHADLPAITVHQVNEIELVCEIHKQGSFVGNK